ncbi:MAG TPA: ATP-binding protein [Nitrospirota bacterium]|nr:ATP-binding protein [Nitrospirota bacterium]
MQTADKRLTLIMSWMAGIAAVMIALGMPLVYFGLSYQHDTASLETEAEINARIVTQLINADPEMWRFEELRLAELMSRRSGEGTKETRRILDTRNILIAESAEKLAPPLLMRSETLMDAGIVVGRIEIIRSLRPLLMKTVLMMVLASMLGSAVFFAIRIFPLRTLRLALKSLFEEKERAQVTLRSIGDGVITTDAEGKVVLINAIAERLTGWTQREAEGKPLTEVFYIINEKTRERCENPVDKVLREGKIVDLANHTALIARDGAERIIADSGAPIRDESGNIIGVVLVFRDATEKQKLEEEILKAGKLESVGILAGGIAHDFNNILTAITGNISLAMRDIKPSDAIFRRLVDAESACLRAKELTYQLLTFSKGGAPVKKTVSVSEIIEDSARLALAGSNVRCKISVPDDLLPADVDEGQISQVINNLLINAVEAMPGGGVITVRAENLTAGKGDALPLAYGKYLKISIQDQGTGILPGHLRKIFDPYFTTKQKGSGLGLAICYSIVKKHDGHISVESVLGSGTTFSIYLPASSKEPARKKDSREEPIRGEGKILVMDDEAIVRDVTGQILKHLGYDAEFAGDGSEAIELYRKAKESGKPFDLVIMDLTVPGGMGGKEAILRLIEIDPDVRAIVSSGYSDNLVMSDFRQYGFKGVVAKPYKIQQLALALHNVLNDRA